MFTHQKLTALNFSREVAKQTLARLRTASTSAMALSPKLIVANNGETFLEKDVLDSAFIAETDIRFLCRPYSSAQAPNTPVQKEKIQKLTVAEIRAKKAAGMNFHFICNLQLAELIETITKNQAITDPRTILPLCIKQDARYFFPLIIPTGESHSIILLQRLSEQEHIVFDAELLHEVNPFTQHKIFSPLRYADVLVNKALLSLIETIFCDYLFTNKNSFNTKAEETNFASVCQNLQSLSTMTKTMTTKLTLCLHPVAVRPHRIRAMIEAEIDVTDEMNARFADRSYTAALINGLVIQLLNRPLIAAAELLDRPPLIIFLSFLGVLWKLITAGLESDDSDVLMVTLLSLGVSIMLLSGLAFFKVRGWLAEQDMQETQDRLSELRAEVSDVDYSALKSILIELKKFEGVLDCWNTQIEMFSRIAHDGVSVEAPSGNRIVQRRS